MVRIADSIPYLYSDGLRPKNVATVKENFACRYNAVVATEQWTNQIRLLMYVVFLDMSKPAGKYSIIQTQLQMSPAVQLKRARSCALMEMCVKAKYRMVDLIIKPRPIKEDSFSQLGLIVSLCLLQFVAT